MASLARFGLLVLVLLPPPALAAQEDVRKARLFVIEYAPGPNWEAGVAYNEQAGAKEHWDYLLNYYDGTVVLMGGPFEDGTGSLFVIDVKTKALAEAIAREDPSVVRDVLTANVSAWTLEMSAMRRMRRVVPDVSEPRPYRIERLDPESPLNTKD